MTAERPQRSWLGRVIRAPLLHFALLGGLLYFVVPTRGPDRVIRVNAGEIEVLKQGWQQRSGLPPNRAQLSRLIAQFVDDALLVTLARDLGWDRDDTVVRNRLIRNWRFLDPESDDTDETVLRKAFASGMERSDIVVKRRLLERVNLMLASRAREQPPSEAELETYLKHHKDDFMRPGRTRLSQIYLSRDRRGDRLHDAATTLSAELRSSGTPPEEAVIRADPFLIQAALPLWSQRQIRDRLGGEFAEGTALLPVHEWSQPIRSSFGEHIVWVHEREAPRLPALSQIRSQVESALYRKREAELKRTTISALRAEFRIEVHEEND